MLKIAAYIKQYRRPITIVLALAGIGLMAYYDHCDTSCSYLTGDILGIDLKWVGIFYMSVIILFTLWNQPSFVRALLAAGLGVEIHLYAFQIRHGVYCPFCLTFSVMLILAFLANYEIPSAWYEKRRQMWLYFLGEVSFPVFRFNKLPLLFFSLLGYLTTLLTFSGSAMPVYGQDRANSIPSIGKGSYEITIFTDYFCAPCRRLNTKSETLLKELLSSNHVKVTFVDVPISKATPVYVKYFLYAANADAGINTLLSVRKKLYDAAQEKNIQKEKDLAGYMKDNKIALKPMDERAVFPLLSARIRDHKIKNTPTYVIKSPENEIKKFVGDEAIWNELVKLKQRLVTTRQ